MRLRVRDSRRTDVSLAEPDATLQMRLSTPANSQTAELQVLSSSASSVRAFGDAVRNFLASVSWTHILAIWDSNHLFWSLVRRRWTVRLELYHCGSTRPE